MKKRIISSLMALALCLSLLPTMAFATGTTYAITNGTPESTKETNHGYITIAKANAAEGETVTVEVHPVDGYQLKSLTVTPAFTVTFDLNGITGTAPEAQEVAKDGKVTEPTDPTDTVHTFAGWYKTIDATTGALSDPWNFDTDTVTADMTLYAKWTRTMESILRTNPDIPEVTNLTPPLNAWVNSTSPDCKAFVGIDEEGDTLFVVKKEGQGVQPLGLLMDDTFVRINENTYKYNDNYVTVIANMTDGKFTSCEWEFTLSGYQFLDGTYTAPNSQCIAAGTMISMPGGKQKAVEELEIGDVICTFDHETGEVSSAPIAFIWESKNVGNAFTLTFEDDIEVTVIEEHGFYDYEEQKYVFINLQNAEEYIGHHFYNADTNSWLELKSCEALNDNVDAYAIITSGHLNHMSNGMLSMCDGTVKVLANIFEYDDQMKFDADKKKADIEAYGLTPKEKILELEGFIESDYDDYNLQYLNVAIGKGLTTWEWIEAFSDYCVENGLVDIYSGSETAEENEAPRLLLMSATAPKSLLGSALKSTPQDGIKITAKEDGTYQFTMPGYPVTVTAEFEEITIADILPDDFPTCVDVLPFNTWDNDNGIHMMLNQDALGLITDESQDFVIAEDIRSAALTRSGNNYIFTNNGVTTTFVMSSNTLVSVEVSGLDDEYDSFNGTYAAEMSVVIDDEEAGTIASVARDANGLNLSGISGGTILLLEPKDNSTNKVVEVHYTEADGGNGYAETRATPHRRKLSRNAGNVI